ncbi:hypothetical protein IFM89_009217 [Coptis chinensis]|uniref:Uncharacterized protein n=1 Tax=Coptis chinensis TaxID=261450 RepID=A0A835MEP8_9MAGN|nr:hypothetical protein IFM89_009217 [Coptis chinensis]
MSLGESARYGVDINTGGIIDTFANFVWELAVVKVFNVLSHVALFSFFLPTLVVIANVSDKCYKCEQRANLPNSKCGRDREEPKAESIQGGDARLERWVEGGMRGFVGRKGNL